MTACRYDRETGKHQTREHRPDCVSNTCRGCQPCTHDDDGNPIRHCRVRTRCVSHLGWDEYACPTCLGKIRDNLAAITDALTLMPAEAEERGVNSEPANLAGPHADYVTAQWRLVNADRAGQSVEELDMRDPYTCLTFCEREIREHLGHDDITLVSPTIPKAASYIAWALTDLAHDEEMTRTLESVLGHTSRLRGHIEAALRDSRTPERGIPCPECVKAEKGTPRLVRHYGHWCERDGCERIHYLDTDGDVWRCPEGHEWKHADYEDRLVERRKTA